jgi:hypothetical protein
MSAANVRSEPIAETVGTFSDLEGLDGLQARLERLRGV